MLVVDSEKYVMQETPWKATQILGAIVLLSLGVVALLASLEMLGLVVNFDFT